MSLQDITDNWDLVIIGGGITGAGIFHEITRTGLKVILLEQMDFAWGTSSRSSKLVHGGLRYLKEGRFFLTRDAVKERERLLQEAPGLVNPLEFLVPVYERRGPGKWTLEAGLSIYDLMAKKRQHKFLSPKQMAEHVPLIDRKDLVGGFYFYDAQVDDARLVLRLIIEGMQTGGSALNYTAVKNINRNERGKVTGVVIEDVETHETKVLSAKCVINATGCWAERLHPSPNHNLHIRPLRGSHLILPSRNLPLDQAVSFMHPSDNRAVFAIPWEGAVIVGTTDLDHRQDLSIEPAITPEEMDYLLEGINRLFPSLGLTADDCLSTIAGVRPVLSDGKLSPSEESREHIVWKDKGLVTITGGKLTTFRKLAIDTLKEVKAFLPEVQVPDSGAPGFMPLDSPPDPPAGLSADQWLILLGRYGKSAEAVVQGAAPEHLETIPGTHTLWAELPYAAQNERIRHLDDLLLRRVRIGLLLPEGGRDYFQRIQSLCAPVLPWTRKHWKTEMRRYRIQWQSAHFVPGKKIRLSGKIKKIFAGIQSWFRKS